MEQPIQPAQEIPPPPKGFFKRAWNFAKAVWNDHDFWLRALAVKGAASAIAVAGAIGITHAVTWPLIPAVAAVSACTGLIGFGVYGVVIGGAYAYDKLREIYAHSFKGKEPAKREPALRRLYKRLRGSKLVNSLLKRPLMQKFLASRSGQFMRRQLRTEHNVFLASFAGAGSALWGAVGAIGLAAVLPALAIGTIFTFSTLVAAGSVMSGCYGIYLSAQSLTRHIRTRRAAASRLRERKKNHEQQPATEETAAAHSVTAASVPETGPADAFSDAAKRAAAEAKQSAQQAKPQNPPPTP